MRFVFLLSAFLLSAYSQSASNPAVKPQAEYKTVTYRGGIVVFSIPYNWLEEYVPSGGATFYEDRPDSGTLRLSVLGFDSDSTSPQEMAARAFPAGSFELLPNGFPIQYSVKEVTENNEALHIHKWSVAVPVPPHSLRLVMFHHTILANQESVPEIKAELSFLQQSIRSAKFSQVAGVAGDFHE